MAIIDKFEVTVKIDGKVLEEYDAYANPPPDDPVNDHSEAQRAKEARNYIEAQSGASFTIECRMLSGYNFAGADCVVFHSEVDGQWIESPLIQARRYPSTQDKPREIMGHRFGNGDDTKIRRLKFGQLTLVLIDKTSDQVVKDEKQRKFGTIQVTVWPKKGFPAPELGWSQHSQMKENSGVSKKIVKCNGIELLANLESPSPCRPKTRWHTVQINGKPDASFCFYYRSKDALEMLGILDPPEVAATEVRSVDDLTPEELKQLVQQYRDQEEATKQKIKEEKAEQIQNDFKQGTRKRLINLDEESDIEEISPPPKQQKVRHVSVHEEIL